MRRVTLARTITVPDPVRLGRYQRAPELGPRALFFSAGTALRGVSRDQRRLVEALVSLV